MAWEAGEGRTSGAASIHDSGDASVDTPQVGMHTGAVNPFEDVSMQVNQARGDDFARHLQDARGLLARDRRRDARNRAILDCNIVDAVQADRWVNHGATLE